MIMDLPITDDGIRPAGKPTECFYCHRPKGEHELDCVTVQKSVVLKMTIMMVVSVPRCSDEDNINFFFNESSSCANNVLDDLSDWAAQKGNCICGAHETEFLRDATEEDHRTLPLASSDLWTPEQAVN